MSETGPRRAPVAPGPLSSADGALTVTDESTAPIWRVFTDDLAPGNSRRSDETLVWSVTPGESTVLGPRPEGDDAVDLAHVRAVFRLTGPRAPALLSRICALDFGEAMFPDGAAARTLVAGVATEIVRTDRVGLISYLLLPSRSFGRYLFDVLADAGREFGLAPEG